MSFDRVQFPNAQKWNPNLIFKFVQSWQTSSSDALDLIETGEHPEYSVLFIEVVVSGIRRDLRMQFQL